MIEQELKEVLQGALDGKEIQCLWYPNGSYQKVNWDELSTLIAGLHSYQNEYSFRVKPDVKVFKYKTRPCSFERVTGSINLDLWSSTCGITEEAFKNNRTFFQGGFKWLAHVTDHEVEYA